MTIKNQISALKAVIQKCPRTDSENEQFEHFKAFFFSFDGFRKTVKAQQPDQRLKDKFYYHLEMLWKHLLGEFLGPYWHYDNNGYNEATAQKYWHCGPVNIDRLKILIKEAITRDELKSFFKAYPYVKDLIKIDDWLEDHFTDSEEELFFYYRRLFDSLASL